MFNSILLVYILNFYNSLYFSIEWYGIIHDMTRNEILNNHKYRYLYTTVSDSTKKIVNKRIGPFEEGLKNVKRYFQRISLYCKAKMWFNVKIHLKCIIIIFFNNHIILFKCYNFNKLIFNLWLLNNQIKNNKFYIWKEINEIPTNYLIMKTNLSLFSIYFLKMIIIKSDYNSIIKFELYFIFI